MFRAKNGVGIMKDNKMKVVHDNDLEQLLKSLNVYEGVFHSDYKCLFCNRIITLENIDSIVPYERSIQFTCDNPECHLKLLGWGK